MAEATITVPAEHVAAFREGILSEIESDLRWSKQMHEETYNHLLGRIPGEAIEAGQLKDLTGPMKAMMEDAMILAQVWTWDDDGPVEVTGDSDAIAHALRATADRIIAPELKDQVNVSPIDGDTAENVEALTTSLSWMIDSAAELNEAVAV